MNTEEPRQSKPLKYGHLAKAASGAGTDWSTYISHNKLTLKFGHPTIPLTE